MADGSTAARTAAPDALDVVAVDWHSLDGDEVERRLETGGHGLTDADAAARRSRYGPNQLEEEPPTPAWMVFARQFRSPLIFILLAALAVTLLLGEHLDAAVIAAVLVLNAVIGFTQERRAESAVLALMQLVVPHAASSVTVATRRSTAGIWSQATSSCWNPVRGFQPICASSE